MIRVFIGYDDNEKVAFSTLSHSLLKHSTQPLAITPIRLQNIKDIFSKYLQKAPLPSNLEQAMVPSKAIVLQNPIGTAPGMWLVKYINTNLNGTVSL